MSFISSGPHLTSRGRRREGRNRTKSERLRPENVLNEFWDNARYVATTYRGPNVCEFWGEAPARDVGNVEPAVGLVTAGSGARDAVTLFCVFD